MNGPIRPGASSRHVAAPASGAATAPRGRAGVVTRLLAAAVDGVVVVVLAALVDLGAAGARFLWSPVDFRWPQPTTSLVVAVLVAVAVVYLSVGWALAGRTYGSKLIGLRVLSSRLELLSWIRSVLRALVCVLWPVGLLWCGIDRTRRSVADLVVRTVVVYDAQPYVRVPDGS
ncbi:RDD family protein [Blastococcus sp. CT_GayMR20]|uniref:RDD family protein n=1 Tax=Blastococcus sp. CT_GayMR20 TaxID=2559609 RepID=UPI001ADDDFC0|nr:RDD family protein [Blastococcus sp. CT_GayMR20]